MTAEPLDLETLGQLRDAVGDDALGDIVKIYVDESSKSLRALHVAVSAGDAATVTQRSHSLHTSSATVGARALASACKELESRARIGALDRAEEMARLVGLLHASSVDALERYCASDRTS